MAQIQHNPYDALLRAIDFFSQNLHLEQITQYGFRLFDDLIKPDQAVLYLKTESVFKAVYQTGYTVETPDIPYTKSHNDFAVYSGFILEHRDAMERFFETDILDLFEAEYIMPLISGNELLGFIFYNGSNVVPKPDTAFMTRFNHLLNLALEKACRFHESEAMKGEIDKRLFNLASLSQTTKLLLSEFETEKIYNLCIDVIRELTSSSVTSFSTVDTVTGHLRTRAYKDIIQFDKKVFEFKLKDNTSVPHKVIYNVRTEFDSLSDIFTNAEAFIEAKAIYAVLLIKDNVVGCITIGEPVGATVYDEKLLSQIENVAGLVHLALTNARQYEQLLEQKLFMEKQAQLLKKINRSVKIINSAESLDELCQVSMDTLQYVFGVESGFIAAYSDGMIEIKAPIGFNSDILEPICQEQIRFQINDELLISYTRPDLQAYFCSSLADKLPDPNCLVIAPIRTTGWRSEPLGCIVVLRMSTALREEHTILIDSLSDSIAPVVRQYYQIEDMKRKFKVDPEMRVEELFNGYQRDQIEFGIDYGVYMKYLESVPFTQADYSPYLGKDFVHIQNIIVVFSSVPMDTADFDHTVLPNDFEDIVEGVQMLHTNNQKMDTKNLC